MNIMIILFEDYIIQMQYVIQTPLGDVDPLTSDYTPSSDPIQTPFSRVHHL